MLLLLTPHTFSTFLVHPRLATTAAATYYDDFLKENGFFTTSTSVFVKSHLLTHNFCSPFISGMCVVLLFNPKF